MSAVKTRCPVLIGTVVSHYRILHSLGRGGAGLVYEAEDLRLYRHVALKFLSEDLARTAPALPRFRREAQATILSLKTDFLLDPLRSDLRFTALVNKVGLPK